MESIKMLTINQYATYFGISVRTVHRMISEETINAVDLNNGKKKKSIWRIPFDMSDLKFNKVVSA